MPFLRLRDGVTLHYERRGQGPQIVLVPGWTITTRFWERQVDDLARDHEVVTLDLRGAGTSGKTPDLHSLAAYAEDLRELLVRLELENATLVCWAMGVSVAVHLVAAGGEPRPRALVWTDHSPRFFTAPGWRYPLFGDLTPAALDETLHQLRHDREQATRDLLGVMFAEPEEWMVGELMQTPTEVAVTMLAGVAAADLRPLLPLVDLPVLVVNGGKSVVPPDVGLWLERELPQARRVLLEAAGHAPYWDDPAGFNAAVRSFVAELA